MWKHAFSYILIFLYFFGGGYDIGVWTEGLVLAKHMF
jgi:hypothetical protein